MRVSYDYDDLLAELQEELEDGVLVLHDIIQILRAEKPIRGLYRPIVDWYYDEEEMTEQKSDLPAEELDKYLRDKPHLEAVTVKECLQEMRKWSTIL